MSLCKRDGCGFDRTQGNDIFIFMLLRQYVTMATYEVTEDQRKKQHTTFTLKLVFNRHLKCNFNPLQISNPSHLWFGKGLDESVIRNLPYAHMYLYLCIYNLILYGNRHGHRFYLRQSFRHAIYNSSNSNEKLYSTISLLTWSVKTLRDCFLVLSCYLRNKT